MRVRGRPSRTESSGRLAIGLVGLALFAAAIGWTYVAASVSGGEARSVALLFLASAAGFVVARLMAAVSRRLVPAIVVLGSALLAAASIDGLLSRSPLSGPFGYANADGAFFAEASIAGLMLAAASRRTEARVLGGGAAAAFAAVPFVRGSLAAAALVVVLPIMGLVCIWLGGPRLGVAACAALFLLVLVGTVILGARYAPGRPGGTLDRLVDATLSQRRVALWHDALVIMVEHPTGVGPGRFAVASPTARADVDARWAHNGFLQQGAEAGPVGFTLIVLLFLWAFARLWMSPAPDVVTVLGAAALAALGIHACIDYVLHFPAVPIVTAALVGAAAGPAVPLDPSVLRGDQDARRDARP